MKNTFILFNLHGEVEKQLKNNGFTKTEDQIMRNGEEWNQIEIIPYYYNGYWCLTTQNKANFNQLWSFFLNGNDDELIGSISLIVDKYPKQLLSQVTQDINLLKKKIVKFLLNDVIPDYLPIVVDRKKIMTQIIPEEYEKNIWVKLLNELKTVSNEKLNR